MTMHATRFSMRLSESAVMCARDWQEEVQSQELGP